LANSKTECIIRLHTAPKLGHIHKCIKRAQFLPFRDLGSDICHIGKRGKYGPILLLLQLDMSVRETEVWNVEICILSLLLYQRALRVSDLFSHRVRKVMTCPLNFPFSFW
ncbi:unnamed protein product, partial [Gulo gulo]